MDPEPIGTPYEGEPERLPHDLVRAGDILQITAGPNAGWYRIHAIPDAETLTLVDDPELPLGAASVEDMTHQTEQPFVVFRQESAVIVDGITASGNETSHGLVFPGANLRWDGVAPGDRVVIGGRGSYAIASVDSDERVTLAAPAPDVSDAAAAILRPQVLHVVKLSRTGGLAADPSGGHIVNVADGGLLLADIQPGDRLYLLDGDYAGMSFTLVGASTMDADATLVLLDPIPGDPGDTCQWQILRGDERDPLIDETAVERDAPADRACFTLITSEQDIFWVGDLYYEGEGVWSSATDIEDTMLSSPYGTTEGWVVDLDIVSVITLHEGTLATDLPDSATFLLETLNGNPISATPIYVSATGSRARSHLEMGLVRAYRPHTQRVYGSLPSGERLTGTDANGDPFSVFIGATEFRTSTIGEERGRHEILAVEGHTITINHTDTPEIGTTVHAVFRNSAESWNLSHDSAVYYGTNHPRIADILPGDRFVLPSGQKFWIRTVSGNEVFFYEDSLLTGNYSARVERLR